MQHHDRGAAFLRIMRDELVNLDFEFPADGEGRHSGGRGWWRWIHRSHSPITKSIEPRIATTSLTMCPGNRKGSTLKFTNEGARIFNRCGVPPPRLLR